MDSVNGRLVVSATDLVGYLACGHLTTLNRSRLGADARPRREDPELAVLQRRGLEHEAEYLGRLSKEGLRVVEIAEIDNETDRLSSLRSREAETLEAMTNAVDVVFQATFLDDEGDVAWRGHADFLRRVDQPSRLGAYRYEPEDTKLARHVKPSAVLQLCLYAEQVARLQGETPEWIHVVLGGQERVSIRLAEVTAYYRAARSRFLDALAKPVDTYPVPVAHCGLCAWGETCEQQWEVDDHLSRVAGLTREQVRKLASAEITTLAGLAASGDEVLVKGIGVDTLKRLRRQARLQTMGREGEPPPFELIQPTEQGRGLAALPLPDVGDLFYDIEGDPFVGPSGLEYLHGVGWVDDAGLQFEAIWAHTAAEERAAFERLIDLIVERRRRYPSMHVYHYAPYEPSALGKLMGRYGTREEELDDLLRGGVFVDLYRAVRQGLVIGSRSYSLKKLEPLYMEPRTGEITDAGSSIVEYERWLQTDDPQILRDIEAYNRDDVESTWRLRDWLEERRAELVSAEGDVPRPAAAAPNTGLEGPVDTPDEIEQLIDELLAGRPEPPDENNAEDERARWVMAHLLRWHQREDKPEWWQYFRRVLDFDLRDLYDDTEAVAGLEVQGVPEPDKSSLIWTYSFDPDQEHKLKVSVRPVDPDSERQNLLTDAGIPSPGVLVALDPVAGTLQLRRAARSEAPHPAALIPGGPIKTNEQRESLRRLARAVLAHGTDGPGPYLAARRLLARVPPRITGVERGSPLRQPAEDTLTAAVRLGTSLDQSCLPIQGPPGAGKTFTAAHVIVALLDQDKKVGITANSHAVISNLLREVLKVAAIQRVAVRGIQKSSGDTDAVDHDDVQVTDSNPRVIAGLADDRNLVAGTSWLFARADMAEALDTLVVDEAGQLSLANVLAVAPAARNVLLVGDPQQLAQPSKGTHPERAGVSGLDHVLGGHDTIPDDLGLFLDLTWRLHPEISAFISEQVYENRLESEPDCAKQVIGAGPMVEGSGLRWVPVEHQGNRTSSEEEAVAVAQIVTSLLGRPWTDRAGHEPKLTLEDVLVVAPYNAQVHLLAESLPAGARVGTVDRFQGQGAAVVVFSLTASSAEEVPRGMEFLYSRNRINVAVSRAKALSVVVGSPALLAVSCRTVDQMRLANVLCRYVEMATPVALA